ncbi:MAG: hypothetical protein ACI9WU_002731 [Myxococcota bacterium]|jgi:uncharacterized protein (DUF1501 family)
MTTRRNMTIGRRRLLQGLGALAGTGLSGELSGLFTQVARAQTAFDADSTPLLLVCTFDGGWDQLLGLDPRNSKTPPSAGIAPSYDLVAGSSPVVQQALSATGGTGLVTPQGSAITFGPAVGKLADLYADLCVVRGINMGTLTHEVGRRYNLTGKFPRGLAASGSSLGTWHAHQTGDLTPIPNLVVSGESFNEGLHGFATGLQVRQSFDLLTVLAALGEPLSAAAQQAVDAWAWVPKCSDQLYDGEGAVTRFLDAREKSAALADGSLAGHFRFNGGTNATVDALKAHFGVATNADLNGPAGQAMIAVQALTQGVSQAVHIPLATASIDHHDDDYQSDHAPALVAGFEALADTIAWLKQARDANNQPFWDRTTLLVTSDFARTPRLNGRGGRDHHLASSCLLAGAGIRGNTVVGATDDAAMGIRGIDPTTGAAVSEGGILVRPPDIHATLTKAMGIGHEHIDNQDPVVLSAALA